MVLYQPGEAFVRAAVWGLREPDGEDGGVGEIADGIAGAWGVSGDGYEFGFTFEFGRGELRRPIFASQPVSLMTNVFKTGGIYRLL